MNFNWSIIGWVIVIGLFVFYPIGLYEGRGRGYKKRQVEEAQEKKDDPIPTPIPPALVKVDDPGLLRIKNENGSLTLDLDGTRADTSSLSAEQRKRLIEMLNLMRPWLEGRPASAPAPVTTPPPPSQPMPAPVIAVSPTPPSIPQPQPIAPKPATVAKEDRPSLPATSMVGQIDSVLQARIAGTPLEERGVFLAQSPDGGVMVYVGLTKYMAIDDVPDAEVIAAIRAAIKEWENKYTPGMK